MDIFLLLAPQAHSWRLAGAHLEARHLTQAAGGGGLVRGLLRVEIRGGQGHGGLGLGDFVFLAGDALDLPEGGLLRGEVGCCCGVRYQLSEETNEIEVSSGEKLWVN